MTNGTGESHFSPTLGVTRAQMASFLTRALGLGVSDVDFFIDDDSSLHQPDINSIADLGITAGCTQSLFCPTDGLTRGEMSMFLFRALQPEPSHTNFFADDDGHPFEQAIDALASHGIVLGTGDDRFQPDGMITREQMASLLARAFDL